MSTCNARAPKRACMDAEDFERATSSRKIVSRTDDGARETIIDTVYILACMCRTISPAWVANQRPMYVSNG